MSGRIFISGVLETTTHIELTTKDGGYFYVYLYTDLFGIKATGEIEAKNFADTEQLANGNGYLWIFVELDTRAFQDELTMALQKLASGVRDVGEAARSSARKLMESRGALKNALIKKRNKCLSDCDSEILAGVGDAVD